MKTAIIGAGALGRIAANILRPKENPVFYDDDESKVGEEINGIDVVGTVDDVSKLNPQETSLLIGIGDITVRKHVYERFASKGFSFAKAIHPTASIAPTAEISDGVIIKDQATIEPSAKVDANSIIGNGTIICHDSQINEHCRLAPSVTVAGHSTIGHSSYLALNVAVDRKISIGKNVVIASGCTIWKDVPDNSIVKLPHDMDIRRRN